MARRGEKLLTVGAINKAKPVAGKKRARFADGANLYLQASRGQGGRVSRSWIFRYKLPFAEAERDLGLGSLDSVGVGLARKLAAEARELVAQGIDPIVNHRETLAARRAADAKKAAIPTFDQCSTDYIREHQNSWRNPKHRQQWVNTLATYASPVIGKLPVNEINVDHVLKVIKPIWHEKTDTAKRVRGRIETVLDFAKANKKREGENPARWDGNLKHLLASPEKIAPVTHHAALDYHQAGEFMAQLRQREGIGALALEFTILTCARTSETVGATWDEIDLDEKLWIVPANRIKAGREHRVPLSKAALAVLRKVREISAKIGGPVAKSKLVFPNDRTGEQLSDAGMSSILKRMKYDNITIYGMRSVFRDWAGEVSHFPNDIIEVALAHSVGTKVEQAYRRKTGFEKRRLLAEAWASYCAKPVASDNVVNIRA